MADVRIVTMLGDRSEIGEPVRLDLATLVRAHRDADTLVFYVRQHQAEAADFVRRACKRTTAMPIRLQRWEGLLAQLRRLGVAMRQHGNLVSVRAGELRNVLADGG